MLKLLTLILSVLILSSCGKENRRRMGQSNSGCGAGITSLAIYDHRLQVTCGCDNITSGTFFEFNQALNCTLPATQKIIIQYLGISLNHQFTSSGSPHFPSSPAYLPRSENPHKVYTFKLSGTGTYSFQDAFTPELSGSFTAY